MSKQSGNGTEIPHRFRREVVLHIVKNFHPQYDTNVPLLFGIHGPSGEGKTFQCEQVLREMGTRMYLISGGQLESDNAGAPAKLIRTSYLNASKVIEQKESTFAAIIINDIDTGLGDWGELVQTTVNRQTVFGELMHLVDYPTSVEGRKTKRIPIIITGNDFTKLYEPLVRPGRMTSFSWTPTAEEKVVIISRIFNNLSVAECRELMEKLEEAHRLSQPNIGSLPIAAYSHLKSTLSDNYLWTQIIKVGIKQTVELIGRGHFPVIDAKYAFDEIILAGEELVRSGQLFNHLWRKR